MANSQDNHRLRNRADFEKIKKFGKLVRSKRWIVANTYSNNLNRIRIGWTIPGYVGTAVVRNRLKRWMREYVKRLPQKTKDKAIDVNIVLRRENGDFYSQLKHGELDIALKSIFDSI